MAPTNKYSWQNCNRLETVRWCAKSNVLLNNRLKCAALRPLTNSTCFTKDTKSSSPNHRIRTSERVSSRFWNLVHQYIQSSSTNHPAPRGDSIWDPSCSRFHCELAPYVAAPLPDSRAFIWVGWYGRYCRTEKYAFKPVFERIARNEVKLVWFTHRSAHSRRDTFTPVCGQHNRQAASSPDWVTFGPGVCFYGDTVTNYS